MRGVRVAASPTRKVSQQVLKGVEGAKGSLKGVEGATPRRVAQLIIRKVIVPGGRGRQGDVDLAIAVLNDLDVHAFGDGHPVLG